MSKAWPARCKASFETLKGTVPVVPAYTMSVEPHDYSPSSRSYDAIKYAQRALNQILGIVQLYVRHGYFTKEQITILKALLPRVKNVLLNVKFGRYK